MKSLKPGLLSAAAILFLALPVFAAPPADRNPNSPGNGWGPPSTRGAPGPLVGAGLPFLIVAGVAGAYKLARRRRDASKPQHHSIETTR